MPELTWTPILTNPHMVDASELHRRELESSETLNKLLSQTAAAIGCYPPQPASVPDYQPSRGTTLFGGADENIDVSLLTSIAPALHLVSTMVPPLKPSITPGPTSWPHLQVLAAHPHLLVLIRPLASAGGDVAAASAGVDNTTASARIDTAILSTGIGNAAAATSVEDVPASTAIVDTGASAAAADAEDFAAADAEDTAATNAEDTAASAGADKAAASVPPPRKKKRSEMGEEERRIMRREAEERAQKLTADINALLEEQDALYVKYADLNNVSVDRIQKLAHQVPSMKPQKKASDYNIVVYFKGKELNEGKVSLKELHQKVKDDSDLQEILEDTEAMQALRQKYNDEKAQEKISAIRVSKRAQAKTVSEKVNLFQHEADFLYEAANANTFGMVVRGSYESTVVSSYYGHGSANAFFRKHFNLGVQDVLNLYKSFVVALEKVGSRKLYVTEMSSEIVRMITQGLREITGIANLTMSYVSFTKSIAVPYSVNITGWPEDIPRVYPQQLPADQTKVLYEAWNTGKAHWYTMTAAEARSFERKAEENGELEPRTRKKRSDTGSSRRPVNTNDKGNEDDDEDDEPCSAKGSKRKRGADKDGDDRRKKKAKGAAQQASGAKKTQSAKTKKPAEGGTKSAAAKGKTPARGKGQKGKSVQFIVSNSEDPTTDSEADDDDRDSADFSS
ncbi:hypothetical protein BT96DRAFT_1000778 [Gymnopus androsaceus JB14]|uniref:Uncharacterized protein n=1 Tax=Gymnopus androsaceus JB14 TaxID=1447944 RepID=A0A6A4H2V8_9AGAR|nr:hypothetical protein BT96DRAFT_1000778 [Gymnopus androsaceus JB14]